MSLIKKSFIAVFVLFFGATSLVFAGSQKPEYIIRFAHGLPPNHSIAENYDFFKKRVEQSSKGRISVKLFPAGQLVNEKRVLRAVKSGAIEACAVYTFYIARVCPSFSIFTIPMVYQNTQQTIDAIEGPIGDVLFSELRAKGYFPLGWIDWPLEVGGLESNAPVHVPLDLNGKVLRPVSRETALYLEIYGKAQVAFVSGAELYTAIQRGTLDGAVAGLDHAVERKLSEVAPYFCVLPGFVIAHAVIFVNKRFYDKLPIDLQKMLKDAAIETQKNSYKVADKMVAVITKKAKACLKEVYYPTKDDLQLWNANLDIFFREALKNNPETLKLVTSERKRIKKAAEGE